MEYFTPLPDNEHSTNWRKLATDLGYTGPIRWQVKAGFTLKKHAPVMGNCYKDFQYLQGWNFVDEPTVDCIVYWIPRLLRDSTSKNAKEQKILLKEISTKYTIELNSFGSAAILAGLILSHFKSTGERTPLNQFYVRTDTLRSGGFRLRVGFFDETGLHCDYWYWDDERDGSLGAFPLGEELGTLEPRHTGTWTLGHLASEATLRDAFAGAALTGLLGGANVFKDANGEVLTNTPHTTALLAYKFADEMLEVRAKADNQS